MITINIEQLLADTLGEEVVQVYTTQESFNNTFAHDYHIAYAYGPESAPISVHERVADIGAQQLGIPVERYLKIWDEAVAVIVEFHNHPLEFIDPKYLIEDGND